MEGTSHAPSKGPTSWRWLGDKPEGDLNYYNCSRKRLDSASGWAVVVVALVPVPPSPGALVYAKVGDAPGAEGAGLSFDRLEPTPVTAAS